MFPIICIALVLRLGHATGGARVLIWSMDMLRLAAAACCVTLAVFPVVSGNFLHVVWVSCFYRTISNKDENLYIRRHNIAER